VTGSGASSVGCRGGQRPPRSRRVRVSATGAGRDQAQVWAGTTTASRQILALQAGGPTVARGVDRLSPARTSGRRWHGARPSCARGVPQGDTSRRSRSFGCPFLGLAGNLYFGPLRLPSASRGLPEGGRRGKAITLDAALGEAYRWRALRRPTGNGHGPPPGDYALELEPGNADVRHHYAHYLLAMNRGADSVASATRSSTAVPAGALLLPGLALHLVGN
jgi:hypothetical protein